MNNVPPLIALELVELIVGIEAVEKLNAPPPFVAKVTSAGLINVPARPVKAPVAELAVVKVAAVKELLVMVPVPCADAPDNVPSAKMGEALAAGTTARAATKAREAKVVRTEKCFMVERPRKECSQVIQSTPGSVNQKNTETVEDSRNM
ncbi:MAG: hypothetical protein V4555_04850 [Acidobacteriota bacterium]